MAKNHIQLTKEYIQDAFSALQGIEDLSRRGTFFSNYVVEDVTWTMAGSAYDMAGTRYSLADHSNVTFNALG